MKKFAMLGAVALLGLSAQANAQANLTSATLTGPTGTVWNTSPDGFYTLFVRTSNVGPFFNPNDEALNVSVSNSGDSNFLVNGEGFRPTDTVNSDLIYTLTLGFADGQTLTGSYDSNLNSFLGGSSFTSGGFTYSLTEFSWERSLAQVVSAYNATPGGDSADYSGNFNIAAAAVPEPAAWAMMILGVGGIGGSLRHRRAKKTTVSFA